MNTQNVNVKTATRESSERWVKTLLEMLEAVQKKASGVLFDFQRKPDKAALYAATCQLDAELIRMVTGVPAVDIIQQRVDELNEFLTVMMQLSGHDAVNKSAVEPERPDVRQRITHAGKRLRFIPSFFFTPCADNMAADWLRQHSDYDGGYWDYWIIPQGTGGNVAPNSIRFTTTDTGYIAPEGEQCYNMVIPGNYFEAEVSADAAGIIATLMILNRLAWQTSEMGPQYQSICQRLIGRQDALKDYVSIIKHPEAHLIFRAID